MLKELDNKDTQMTAASATGYTSELSEKLPSLELRCTAVTLSALCRFIYLKNSSRHPFSAQKQSSLHLLCSPCQITLTSTPTVCAGASAGTRCVKKPMASAAPHLENKVPLLHLFQLLLERYTNYCDSSGESPSPVFPSDTNSQILLLERELWDWARSSNTAIPV